MMKDLVILPEATEQGRLMGTEEQKLSAHRQLDHLWRVQGAVEIDQPGAIGRRHGSSF